MTLFVQDSTVRRLLGRQVDNPQGSHQRLLLYVELHPDERPFLQSVLAEAQLLDTEEQRDLGVQLMLLAMAEYASADANFPNDVALAALRIARYPELCDVATQLQGWVKRTFTRVVTGDDGTWLFRSERDPVLDGPPLILLGRLLLAMERYFPDESLSHTFGWFTQAMDRWLRACPGVWPALQFYLTSIADEHDGGLQFFSPYLGALFDFSANWARGGFPQLLVYQQQAAAFALTDVPAELLTDVKLPWDAFRILLPKSPLTYGKDGRDFVVDELWCWRDLDSEDFWIIGGRNRLADGSQDYWTLFDRAAPLSVLAEIRIGKVYADPTLGPVATALLNVLRACWLQLAVGHHVPKAPAKPPKGHRWRKPAELPQTSDFILGSDIKITGPNLAPVVEAMCHGDRKFGKVQWVVRGHKRWQAHGPKYSLRKLIWVQPYWKGPVDAPILKRSHELDP